MKKKVCMIVQNKMVKGGIAAVISGYYNSTLEQDYEMIYVESYKDGNKFEKLIKGVFGYFSFIRVILFKKPDLVHIHSSFGPSFYRKIPFIYMASWKNIPIINHIHGADFNEFYVNAKDHKRKKIKKIYNKCSCLIALSDEWKENLSTIVPENKIKVIENYSIIHSDAFLEKQHRSCNNTVLFLGEIGKRKGCYDIPEVIENVSKEISNVKFIIAGAGTEFDEESIKQMIKEKNIENNVFFPGWVSNEKKDNLLKKADIFFLPSYNEGMPMSILDAMGYGLPIVSTNVGGIPKIVHNGINGYSCTPGDLTKFYKSIIKLLKEDDFRKECSRNSMSIIERGYTLDSHLDKLEAVYEEFLK